MKFMKITKGNLLAAGSFALLLSLGAGGAVGLSYYKSAVRTYERSNFKINLPDGEVRPVRVNMAGHGLPKQLLQPDSIRLRARSIKNTSEEPLPLMLAFEGIPGSLVVSAHGDIFDPETQLKVVSPGGKWKFDIYIHLPPEFREQQTPINGEMIIMHATDRRVLATMPINIFWGGA